MQVVEFLRRHSPEHHRALADAGVVDVSETHKFCDLTRP